MQPDEISEYYFDHVNEIKIWIKSIMSKIWIYNIMWFLV